MEFQIAKLFHLIGMAMIASGLIGVFITDLRARKIEDLASYAVIVRTSLVFYRGLVTPGGLMLLASGSYLISKFYGGWSFLSQPWLAGMVALFCYEFIEGNTLMRMHYRSLMRQIARAEEQGKMTQELRDARDETGFSNWSHFLDVPMLMVIISLGAVRPSTWTQALVGVGIALVIATILNVKLPRMHPWKAR